MTVLVILGLTIWAGIQGQKYAQTPEGRAATTRRQAEEMRESVAAKMAEKQNLVAPPTPAPDAVYTLISVDEVPGIKRVLNIRINKIVSEGELREIALKLKSQETGRYERTFMLYYLPDMNLGSGAWATTHFNPNLEVQILGFTVDQAAKPSNISLQGKDVIGRWIDNSPFAAGHIAIYREGDKLFMESTFKDGSSMKVNVAEQKSPAGRRFEDAAGSEHGEFFVINAAGDLQMCGRNGVFAVAKAESR